MRVKGLECVTFSAYHLRTHQGTLSANETKLPKSDFHPTALAPFGRTAPYLL
jgi:hypothetical protein